jgi:hypothetical protein
MRLHVWYFAWALLALLVTSRRALADEPEHVKPRGVAVVATDGATDATWPLARAIYADEMLRPRDIDDARARVLAGEAGTPDLVELAELRAGVKGDDAASRQVLVALAEKLHVAGVVIVLAGTPPSARLFDADTKTFDAAHYAPEKSGDWSGAVKSLERWYLPSAAPLVTAVPKEPEPIAPKDQPKEKSKAFYESPWFWVAIGTALLIGGGVLIATNIQTSDTIHMQVHLP